MEEKIAYQTGIGKTHGKKFPADADLALLTHYHSTKEPVYGNAVEIASEFENLVEEPTVDYLYESIQNNLFGNANIPFPVKTGYIIERDKNQHRIRRKECWICLSIHHLENKCTTHYEREWFNHTKDIFSAFS